MNEFGETPSIYIWPLHHEEGDPYPEDFYRRLADVLNDAGFGWETA